VLQVRGTSVAAMISPFAHEALLSDDHPHTIKGPSGSYVGFAPKCSTRRFQFLPRK